MRSIPFIWLWSLLAAGCMHSLDVNRPPDGAPPSDASADIAPDLLADSAPNDATDKADTVVDVVVYPVDAAPDKAPDTALPLDDTICDELGPGVVFCDGFENAGLVPWEVLMSTQLTSVTQSLDAYRGQGALRVSSYGGWAGVGTDLSQSFTSGDLHLRAYLRIDQVDMTEVSAFFLTNVYRSEVLEVGVGKQGHPFLRSDDGHAAQSTFGLTPGVWACLQLEVKIAQYGGLAKLSVDGQQAATITNADTLPPMGIGRLGVGLLAVGDDNPPVGVLIDEVVVSTGPVPCD